VNLQAPSSPVLPVLPVLSNICPTKLDDFDTLAEQALDFHWSWDHAADDIWCKLAPAKWCGNDAEDLFNLLEQEVTPEFYLRDPQGVALAWITPRRESLARLTLRCTTNRVVGEYTALAYLTVADSCRSYVANNGQATVRQSMDCVCIPEDKMGTDRYRISIPSIHGLLQYTLRIMPYRVGISLPLEMSHIT
jgi:hypothetical protein